ncbi:MAG: hypothetical protein R2705_05850 [Ilumatobacteraceae bacterium]
MWARTRRPARRADHRDPLPAHARETAAEILEALVAGGSAAARSPRRPDPGFDNFVVDAPGRRDEVTALYPMFRSASSATPPAAWVTELRRFWHVHDLGGDPIGHWLGGRWVSLEGPDHVLSRLWFSLAAQAGLVGPGGHVVACTHSGALRALVLGVTGRDPGEPDHARSIDVRIDSTSPDVEEMTLVFDGVSWPVAAPRQASTRQWSSQEPRPATSSRRAPSASA